MAFLKLPVRSCVITTQEKVRPVKAALLEAAIDLLQEHGPSGATARAICDRVGVKQPALYHHYGQLETLHQEAVHAVFMRLANYYVPAKESGSPEESIRSSWSLFMRFARENPLMYSFINSQMIKGVMPESIRVSFLQLVEDLNLLAENTALRVEPFKAAQLLWTGANGAATLVAAAKNNVDIDTDMTDVMLDALMAYLLEKSSV